MHLAARPLISSMTMIFIILKWTCIALSIFQSENAMSSESMTEQSLKLLSCITLTVLKFPLTMRAALVEHSSVSIAFIISLSLN